MREEHMRYLVIRALQTAADQIERTIVLAAGLVAARCFFVQCKQLITRGEAVEEGPGAEVPFWSDARQNMREFCVTLRSARRKRSQAAIEGCRMQP